MFESKVFHLKRELNYIQEVFYGSNQEMTVDNLWSEFAVIAL